MQQTIAIYNEGIFKAIDEATVANLKAAAKKRSFDSLVRALDQRYGK